MTEKHRRRTHHPLTPAHPTEAVIFLQTQHSTVPPDDRNPTDESVDREASVEAERRDESPSLIVHALSFVFVGSWPRAL
ncbi:hypothetical protein RYH80_01600 [Halobaculum sp. MBLA0147]|uniref:hypothetical protein n=1 Tax=Halobaculum sp. MBLA0147 TaxID=3079934 RepID=UPI003525EA3F